MSEELTTAYARGWNLAKTLMVNITVFRTDSDDYGVMPSDEYDGDISNIVHEFDPFGR